ncbi:MAG TPA: NUDIX domain-containing protein [Crinalium sp.]|jgi:hypothetical protein
MSDQSDQHWQTRDRFLSLHSRWMTLIAEHLQDHQGQILEYWRVEKADSAIVLPIQGDRILLPAASYRPGIGQVTLDFPGGRVAEGEDLAVGAIAILKRELGIEVASVTRLVCLNPGGWPVNSSFSNQKLYGWIAYIDETTSPSELVAATYPTNSTGIQDLLQHLICLQCRTVLLEWWFRSANSH